MTHPTTGHSRMTVLAMGSPAGLSHRPLYRTALMMLAFVASIVLVLACRLVPRLVVARREKRSQ